MVFLFRIELGVRRERENGDLGTADLVPRVTLIIILIFYCIFLSAGIHFLFDLDVIGEDEAAMHLGSFCC